MRAVVTGCAGFIGSHLAESLLRDGVEVLGVDEMNDAYDVRLKEWRLARLRASAAFTFLEADVAEAGALDPLPGDGVDVVYHLAARAGVRQSLTRPDVYVDTNVRGTVQTLDWCRRHDLGTFLLASTSSLYGKHNTLPFREDADTDRPLSPYAASKKGAEAMAASYAHLYGMDTPVARFFTVYGPAGRPDMSVFRFVQAVSEGRRVHIHGDGAQRRDFTYVSDIVAGARVLAEKTKGFDVVNLGGDAPVALIDMLNLVEKETGRKADVVHGPLHSADVPATWADLSKARALGWTPRVPLHEGIRHTVAWYQKERAWAKDVATEDR